MSSFDSEVKQNMRSCFPRGKHGDDKLSKSLKPKRKIKSEGTSRENSNLFVNEKKERSESPSWENGWQESSRSRKYAVRSPEQGQFGPKYISSSARRAAKPLWSDKTSASQNDDKIVRKREKVWGLKQEVKTEESGEVDELYVSGSLGKRGRYKNGVQRHSHLPRAGQSNGSAKNRWVFCEHCGLEVFNKDIQKRRHVLVCHLKESRFRCYICNFASKFHARRIKRHFKLAHSEVILKSSEIVNQNFELELQERLKSCFPPDQQWSWGRGTRVKKILCVLCDLKVPHYQSTMKRHVLEKHGKNNTKFSCPYCDFVDSNKLNKMSNHIKGKVLGILLTKLVEFRVSLRDNYI